MNADQLFEAAAASLLAERAEALLRAQPPAKPSACDRYILCAGARSLLAALPTYDDKADGPPVGAWLVAQAAPYLRELAHDGSMSAISPDAQLVTHRFACQAALDYARKRIPDE